MSSYFRAIAIDFDGTLTADGPPSDAALAAIDRVRAAGLKTVLATGRILIELSDVFPLAEHYFDAIVAENGAVVSSGGVLHTLSPPVESELDAALARRGVPCRRGLVLLATYTGFEDRIQEEIRRLGLECRLVYNRGELMILPPGGFFTLGVLLLAFGWWHERRAPAKPTKRAWPNPVISTVHEEVGS